ncbi:MAG: proteasome-type protease [Pegethrix bostrychoides GSE-TBD4-15B]|jgi:putative proteasome-type protease|uniref:Proteasome-type protease n=1 Tax=Pegethrix bostrychoides GSE-TBD4-15B TaxID=2839662 RepID=A0A951P8F4_9CYAN|nr:proteasome-type protease [Pegethrix bostrychoides GSE-TBD4-15B]
MTYCLGIVTRHGLVMAADSRTNAGVDYISTYQKLFDFSAPGDRVILLCSSGNLSITQAVLNVLEQDLRLQASENLHSTATLYDTARYVGNKMRQIQQQERGWLEKDGIDFKCTLLLGGQVRGEAPSLFMIYSQGNFIQATTETPFLQIGETKYGKPILDRTLSYETALEDAAKVALLSIDSTMKSNISVGPPLDLVLYEAHSLRIKHQVRLRSGDPHLVKMRQLWETSLREAFERMPSLDWDSYAQKGE